MDRIQSVLVGIDFSECSGAALAQAVRVARAGRAKVAAVHIVRPVVLPIPDGTILPLSLPPTDLLVEDARKRWSRWAPAQQAGANVEFSAVVGMPRLEMVARARSGAYDLVVVGAHGERDKWKGLGSIAAACVQHASGKVLVVREAHGGPFTSVAACVDFSETSRVALDQAVRVAAVDGASLHVVHVFEDPWRGVDAPADVKARLPDAAAAYKQAVEKHLRKFCEPLAHEIGALKGEFHAVQFHGTGTGLVDFITSRRCDLVVLGTRSKWNVRDFLWGSTAERVVREAPCAVLTVKPPGEKPGAAG